MHGWMDVGASFQFMVDAGLADRTMTALDWRGFGLSSPTASDNYWFPDYVADLDFLLDALSPDQQVDLVGHSMGGNIAMLYAGVRPARVRRLVNLEGFGMKAVPPSEAPARYAQWIDELKAHERGDLGLRPYESLDAVAARLMKTNPRLPHAKALWLAQHWARQEPDGRWTLLGDPRHKLVNPQIYRVEEVLEVWKRIQAPMLSVRAGDDTLGRKVGAAYTYDQYLDRLKVLPAAPTHATVPDSGHMVHHDQPEVLARLIEQFLA